ncbi:ribonuclease H [Senna tora]|uniref:Ribonuclease H n=1 Tax=Senna tora TaxID=362788 RepID=A0A834TL62_9FABA|nr:ribonuclease H [Senna tora]
MLDLKIAATRLTNMGYDKHTGTSVEGKSGGTVFQFTCVYGHPKVSERGILWNYLHQKSQQTEYPWIIMGDFNQVSSASEKLSNCVTINGVDQFRNFMDSSAMIDLLAQGNWYTWHNGRLGDAAVWERLDKCLCNVSWLENYPHTRVVSLASFCSDHSPLVVNMYECIPYRPRPFRFEAMWLLDEACEKVVRDAWLVNKRGSLAYILVSKCREVKSKLKEWNYAHFGHVQKQITNLNEELDHIQRMLVHFNDPPHDLLIRESNVRKELEDKLAKEEIMWAQKARQLCPQQLKDFRPISLCNVVVKIISKILVLRLQSIMERDISPNQNGFVKGRAILDSILLASELMTSIHKERKVKTSWCAYKLDIQKAYDKISWEFLELVMISMGFPQRVIQVIMQCVSTVSYALMLNGQKTGVFHPQRGLRQGDPMSPYLFLLCSNVLSCMLHKAERDRKLQGIRFGRRGPTITHLMYADDTILFFKADPNNCDTIRQLLDNYAWISGQVLNKDKSYIIFSPNTSTHFKSSLPNILGAHTSNKLGKYLGVQVDARINSEDAFKEMMDKIESKLTGWKAKLLSQSARLTLVNSVLQSFPIYQLSVLPLPQKYANRLDAISSNFYWGMRNNKNAIHLAPKAMIFNRKDKGGLGLRQSALVNKALLAKQVWRIFNQSNNMYSQWSRAKYFNNNLEAAPKKTSQPAAVWKCIDKAGKIIWDHLWWKIGNGEAVKLGSRFWWTPNLTNQFHNSTLHQPIKQFINSEMGTWKVDALQQCFTSDVVKDIISTPISLCNSHDSLIWKFSAKGEYSVSEGYQLLSSNGNDILSVDLFPWKFLWSLSMPSKIQNFIWRIVTDALPNLVNLKRHHLQVDETCQLCGLQNETLDHVFLHCSFARAVWFGSSLSIRTEDFAPSSIVECLTTWFNQSQNEDHKVLHLKLLLLQSIWHTRNKFYMEGKVAMPLITIRRAQQQWLEMFIKLIASVMLFKDHLQHASSISRNSLS